MAERTSTPDYLLFSVVMLLLIIGTAMVYSASAVAALLHFQDEYYFLKRQLVWVSLGLIIMLAMARIDYHYWQKWAKPVLFITIILLVCVLIPGMGKVVNGARRWLGSGAMYVQPSEAAKLSTVLFMASLLTGCRGRIRQLVQGIGPILLILGLIFGLILKEPDLGTALSIAGTVFAMLLIAGARKRHLMSLFMLGAVGVLAAVIMEPYRLKRLIAFQDPWSDPLNTGYHMIQSLYALGSGGVFGTGFGMSREKFLYLPEPHTDFIFSVLGEEFGLLGTMTVLLLFFVFAWRGLWLAMNVKDYFGTILAAGITIMVFLQAMMNIAVVTASMPVTGIPLPFLSFGGSALVFSMAGVGILLNISRGTGR